MSLSSIHVGRYIYHGAYINIFSQNLCLSVGVRVFVCTCMVQTTRQKSKGMYVEDVCAFDFGSPFSSLRGKKRMHALIK